LKPRFVVVHLAVVALACTSLAPRPSPAPGPGVPRVVGYLASWGVNSKGTRIAELPARDLTHIFYAFGEIGDDGQARVGNPGTNFDELARLKARNPHLKLAISIGGWTGSGKFSNVALTDSSRRRFAKSAIDLLFVQDSVPSLPLPASRAPFFDGIDIDWEFPVAGGMEGNVERAVDKENFTLLLATLREMLDTAGVQHHRHYELTIAASARPQEIANVEISRIAPLLDFINVMTYDYHSAPGITNFNAPLYSAKGDPTSGLNVDASMRAFLDAGVEPGKLLVGIPFYGHGYGGVPNINDGLFQRGTETPVGWKGMDGDWRVLAATRLRDRNYVRHWDPDAQVPWLYDSTTGTWVSYDDPESVAAKVRYVRENRLGGVVIWELGGDDGALMRAISGR
jgi:chitinase